MSRKIVDPAIRLTAAVALALGMGAIAAAESASNQANSESQTPAYERVERFPVLTHLSGWRVVDDESVIVWSTAFQPYLVELERPVPANALKFAKVIGVTSYGSQVSAGVDWLLVDGIRYQIDSIYKLTREQAEVLARKR